MVSSSVIGIGLSAKFVEKAGADLIIIYNSGRFRMAGRGSLAGMMPYGDANAVVVDMVRFLTVIFVLSRICTAESLFQSRPPGSSTVNSLERLTDYVS